MDAKINPLEGITVIDLTRVTAGAYATMILADHGARVIKVLHFVIRNVSKIN